MNNPSSDLAVYQSESGALEVRFDAKNDTVWLRQDQLAQLFGRERSVITKHLRNIFIEQELEQKSVCASFAHTAADGKTYEVQHYNLDVIISVGYRVKSPEVTRFHQWATQLIKEHLTRGYTLNQQQLKHSAQELYAALNCSNSLSKSGGEYNLHDLSSENIAHVVTNT